MSEKEYKDLVLAEYDRQMAARLLPSELLVPTPANIKAEIVKICEQGSELSAGDEKILYSFVGQKENVGAYRLAFQNGKADPFKQVVKLLARRSVNTNIKYINLLALLIRYPSRPYHPNLNTPAPTVTGVINDPTDERPDSPTNEPLQQPQASNLEVPTHDHKKKSRIMLISGSILIVLLFAGFVAVRLHEERVASYKCMIWIDDRYEPVDCHDNSLKTAPLPINHQLVDRFRQVTKRDTLTPYSVRKVYYAKNYGDVVFFTCDGPDPLDTSKRLLPMTEYILDKYVYHTIH